MGYKETFYQHDVTIRGVVNLDWYEPGCWLAREQVEALVGDPAVVFPCGIPACGWLVASYVLIPDAPRRSVDGVAVVYGDGRRRYSLVVGYGPNLRAAMDAVVVKATRIRQRAFAAGKSSKQVSGMAFISSCSMPPVSGRETGVSSYSR